LKGSAHATAVGGLCDVAYEIGTFHSTLNDAQGKPAASVGKYVMNWEKRGGQWKVVADIFNDK